MNKFQYFRVDKSGPIASVVIENTKKGNSFNQQMWVELYEIFTSLDADDQLRVILLRSEGKHFSTGIDLSTLETLMEDTIKHGNDAPTFLKGKIQFLQKSVSSIEKCRHPVIALVNGLCLGGAVDIVCACDVRLATTSSYFSILETKLGIVADLGTLQRMGRSLPEGRLRELAFTSGIFSAWKAKKWGFVNGLSLTRKGLLKKGMTLAHQIVEMPDYALWETKRSINHNTEDLVEKGLERIAHINSTLLLTEKAKNAFNAMKAKK